MSGWKSDFTLRTTLIADARSVEEKIPTRAATSDSIGKGPGSLHPGLLSIHENPLNELQADTNTEEGAEQ